MTRISSSPQRALPAGSNYNPVDVVVPDANIETKALAGLGQGIEQAARGAFAYKQYQDRIQLEQEKFDYSIARSQALRKNIELENELDKDPNFNSISDTYNKKFTEIQSETLKGLGNNRFASLLNEELVTLEAKRRPVINDMIDKKRTVSNIARADENLNSNIESFVRTNDPVQRESLLSSSIENYANAIPLGDPNRPTLILKAKQEIGKRFALADFQARSPSDQIAILNNEYRKGGSTIMRFIPADERELLLQKAEQARKQSLNSLAADARNQDFLRQRNAELNSMNIIIKGGTVADIPLEQYSILSETQRNNLNKIQEIQNGTYQLNPVEGQQAYDKYSDMFVNNPDMLAKEDPTTIRATVSPDKVDTVLAWQQKAMAGGQAPTDLAERTQVMRNSLALMGLKTKSTEATDFRTRFEESVNYFIDNNKRQPSKSELEDIANDLMAKRSFTEKGWFWDSTETKRGFQIPAGTQTMKPLPAGVEKIMSAPDNVIIDIQTKARENGQEMPSEEEINDWYKKKYGFDLSYAIPDDVNSLQEVIDALEDEKKQQPALYDGVDIEKKAKGIYNKFHKYPRQNPNSNIG